MHHRTVDTEELSKDLLNKWKVKTKDLESDSLGSNTATSAVNGGALGKIT